MSSTRKIAFVHPALMDYRLELFNKLNERYDVTFIFTKQGRGQDDVKENHLKIPLGWNYKIIKSDNIVHNYDMSMYQKLMRELLRKRYDIVLTSTSIYVCFPIAKITGKKFILLTERWYWTSDTFLRKLLNLFMKFIAKHSDAIIATGTRSYESFRSLGTDEKKIFSYPQCAVDYTKLPARDLKQDLGLEGKKIILYLGRIVRLKGLDYLIKSFALLEREKDVVLLIVGNGPFRKECENLAEESDINNIFFIGPVYSYVDKASYYKICDIFVLPSIFLGYRYEGWGLTINEVMAFGKPVVTTDAVGAAYDLVRDDYNGYVIKQKNIKELYRALYKILTKPGLAKKMGENSRKIFEEINDYEKMFKAIVDAINHVQMRK